MNSNENIEPEKEVLLRTLQEGKHLVFFRKLLVLLPKITKAYELRDEYIHGKFDYSFNGRLSIFVQGIENMVRETEREAVINERISYLQREKIETNLDKGIRLIRCKEHLDTYKGGFYEEEVKAIENELGNFMQEKEDGYEHAYISWRPVTDKLEDIHYFDVGVEVKNMKKLLAFLIEKKKISSKLIPSNRYEKDWVICYSRTGNIIKKNELKTSFLALGINNTTKLIIVPLKGKNAYHLLFMGSLAFSPFGLASLLEAFKSLPVEQKSINEEKIQELKDVIQKKQNIPSENTSSIIQNISKITSQKISLGASFVLAGILSTAILGVNMLAPQPKYAITKSIPSDTCSAKQSKIDSLKKILSTYNIKPLNLDSINKKNNEEVLAMEELIKKLEKKAKNNGKFDDFTLSEIRKSLEECIERNRTLKERFKYELEDMKEKIIKKDTLIIHTPKGIEIAIKFENNSSKIKGNKKILDKIKSLIIENKNIICKIKVFKYEREKTATELDMDRMNSVVEYMKDVYEFSNDLYIFDHKIQRGSIIIELLPKI